ncbi:MAG: TIGR02300 family protein [Xanthobacteraceae bacterium]
MAKAELGTKRVCPTTGRKFYDLNKDPVISPYTGEIVPIAVLPTSRRSAPVAPVAPLAPEVEAPEPADVELVPLEEADAEAEGAKKEPLAEGEEEEVEVADGAEDDTFLETDEDEGDDVSDIVGGEREDEEDT